VAERRREADVISRAARERLGAGERDKRPIAVAGAQQSQPARDFCGDWILIVWGVRHRGWSAD
jgi:hypothetical protein